MTPASDRLVRELVGFLGAAPDVLATDQQYEAEPDRGEADVDHREHRDRPAESRADEHDDSRHDCTDAHRDGIGRGLADELLGARRDQEQRVARGVLQRVLQRVLAASGCASSPDSSLGGDGGLADSTPSGMLALGFYDVTSNQRDDGCTGTSVTATGRMFEIYTDPTIGPDFKFINSCVDTTHCPDRNDPFVAAFVVPDLNGDWFGELYSSIKGTTCSLLRFDAHITATGTTVQLALERDELVISNTNTCDVATAQAHASELACTQRQTVTGVPH